MVRGRFVVDPRGVEALRVSDERREAARRIVVAARRIAPVVSGTYKKGLRMVHDRSRDLVTASGTAPHSHLVEWGTGPRPGSGSMPKLRVLARALDAAEERR